MGPSRCRPEIRRFTRTLAVLVLLLVGAPQAATSQTPAAPPPSSDMVEIVADSQERTGDVFILRGNVTIRYRGLILQADEITYDERKRTVAMRGHVVFERDDDRIEADEGRYHLRTGEGFFTGVVGTVGPAPNPSEKHLVSVNPYYFEAERVERHGDGSYLIHNGWVTNCRSGSPKWRLHAARAQIRPLKDVRFYRSTFRLRGVPIFYLPYWWLSADPSPRKSGFLMPVFGNDSRRGFNVGGSYYWAINPQADLTLGGQVFTRGGWTQQGTFRARPSENSTVTIDYFGAEAGRQSLRDSRVQGVDVSGQFVTILYEQRWANGFRAVADISHLSSLRFRQRFAETFNEAVVSEIHARTFVTAEPGTFYFNVFLNRYQNFLSAVPQQSVTLFTAPAVEFGTRPLALTRWENAPLYFSFDSQLAGFRRDEPRFKTPDVVQRFDLYPRLTIPIRLGRYFGLTPTFGFRATRYGARLVDDPSAPGGKRVLNRPIRRITEEITVNLRLPSFARIYRRPGTRIKHVIEPEITYRYVNGVRRFNEILRFDDRDLLTDTHEIEYGLTQRFFFRPARGSQQARELIRWRVRQKYFFDPTFRGALTPGARNVFEAVNALTPFAFADGRRRFSPIISDVRFAVEDYEADFRADYDPDKSKLVNTRLRLGTKLTKLIRISATHFSTRNDVLLQPRSNQVRVLTRYGSTFRRGVNGLVALSWSIEQDFLQSTVVQGSYNWDCCGVAFEFRRLGLGPVRSQNEYRFSFTIANVGAFGTVRREEELY